MGRVVRGRRPDLNTRERVGQALHQRIRALYEVVVGPAALADDSDASAARMLQEVLDEAERDGGSGVLWAAIAAVSTVYPDETRMLEAQRARHSMSRDRYFLWFLSWSARIATLEGSPWRPVQFVVDSVLVDVDRCARYNRHTGIQRVVRETIPRWYGNRSVTLARWDFESHAYESLPPEDEDRVLRWGQVPKQSEALHLDDEHREEPLFVPHRSRVVLPEVASHEQNRLIQALGRYSSNRVAAIGYDCIPLTSPDMMPRPGGTEFLSYMAAIREAELVAGISVAATAEFRGYFQAVAAQGGHVPTVIECELAVDAGPASNSSTPDHADPTIVVVGSHEPRKNHLAILHASERLWREGLRFRLDFYGSPGFSDGFDEQVHLLAKRGRPVAVHVGVDDTTLWAAYRSARFSVFPSLHEGYGLPVSESIASGTPVVTTDYGSTREIAERGGALTIDPRDDAALEDAMKRLLVDDALLDRLRQECASLVPRSWQQYADELWDLVTREAAA